MKERLVGAAVGRDCLPKFRGHGPLLRCAARDAGAAHGRDGAIAANGRTHVCLLAALLLAGCSGSESVPGNQPTSQNPPITNPPPVDPPPPPPAGTPNQPPTARVAQTSNVEEGTVVTLDGSSSSDPENAPLTYRWEQLSGSVATLDSSTAPRPRFTAPEVADDEPLRFRLTVTDSAGAESREEVSFEVLDVAKNLSALVDPKIGTFPPGFINPGPVAPFGMVNVGPDTEGPLNYGGYSVQNLLITGFSHVHMSAGVPKGGQIPVLPFTGALTPGDLSQLGWPNPVPAYASPFNRLTEMAETGYYSASLPRYNVTAELTATTRAALHRYTFGAASGRQLLFDVGRDLGGYHPASVRLDGEVLSGWVESDDAGGYRVFFAARFDTPFTATDKAGAALPAEGDSAGAILAFAEGNAPILAKVGLSYVDAAGALANLDAEIPGWDFESVRAANVAAWDETLSRIAVTGGTAGEQTAFYSALYRAQQFPSLLSDLDGRYPGPDKAIHRDTTRPHYTQFSLWDSYRGQNQLLAEVVPERYRDMLASLLDFHAQGGALPRWQQAGGDASHMSGDPVIPFIADGLCRGLVDGNEPALFSAMQSLVTKRDPQLDALGYLAVPPAQLFEQVEGGPGRTGTTLEYGIADFALALVADARGDHAIAETVAQRSLNYRNLLDPETGWIRPRDEGGAWLTPFLPELGYGFQEGTSWQYSWLAMHDLAGLYERMGGESTVNQRLDQFFLYPASLVPLAVPTIQNQITVFGVAYYGNQYAPGNEHDLQAPYLYAYAGAPWKTAAVARAAASIYTPTPNGLPGNDDLGALSGWLAWTMMGLYPMNPGAPLYIAGSPHFETVRMRRPAGDLRISAPGASLLNRFVTSMSANGLQQPAWLVLPRGATQVEFTTSPVPDMEWGADSRPPSLSTHAIGDFGCRYE